MQGLINGCFNNGPSSFQEQGLMPNTIYSTSRYDWFRYMPTQREVNNREFVRIKKQIQEAGQLLPIMVNEHGQVADGQHRFKACRELNIPVKFYIQVGATPETAMRLNTAGHKWKTEDWIHYYAQKGNEDYQRLLTFVQNSPFATVISIQIAQNSLAQGISDKDPLNIKTGLWKCKNWDSANRLMVRLKTTIPYLHESKSLYQLALIKYNRLPDFDWNRMIRQMETHPEVLIKVADGLQAMEQLDKLYNYRRTRNHVPLLHMYGLINSSYFARIKKGK